MVTVTVVEVALLATFEATFRASAAGCFNVVDVELLAILDITDRSFSPVVITVEVSWNSVVVTLYVKG